MGRFITKIKSSKISLVRHVMHKIGRFTHTKFYSDIITEKPFGRRRFICQNNITMIFKNYNICIGLKWFRIRSSGGL